MDKKKIDPKAAETMKELQTTILKGFGDFKEINGELLKAAERCKMDLLVQIYSLADRIIDTYQKAYKKELEG